MNETKVNRDDYYVLHVTMETGFEFKIPARGWNLKSWLAFEEKLRSEVVYEKTSQAVYDHLIYGDPSVPLVIEEETPSGSTIKRKTQRANSPKGNSDKAKGEDSKGTATRKRKATTSASKEKPSIVRKPAVRNMRKSKKDVQGTNDSGKETPTRSRRTKRPSQ